MWKQAYCTPEYNSGVGSVFFHSSSLLISSLPLFLTSFLFCFITLISLTLLLPFVFLFPFFIITWRSNGIYEDKTYLKLPSHNGSGRVSISYTGLPFGKYKDLMFERCSGFHFIGRNGASADFSEPAQSSLSILKTVATWCSSFLLAQLLSFHLCSFEYHPNLQHTRWYGYAHPLPCAEGLLSRCFVVPMFDLGWWNRKKRIRPCSAGNNNKKWCLAYLLKWHFFRVNFTFFSSLY